MRILIAILLLGLIIWFHELGHFLLAKRNHIVVLEFALGMGPKILSFRRGETVYAWRILPFGGSCTMLGEDDPEAGRGKGTFAGAALWRRALVVAAGPCFNFILALIAAMIVIGAAGAVPARVTEVPADSPAAAAGLREGDMIVSFEGNGIANADELYIDNFLSGVPTDQIHLTVKRDGEKIRISYAPETEYRYMLGFYFQDTTDGSGVQITQLTKGGAMREAGIAVGDVVTALNGQPVHSVEELWDYLDAHPLDGTPVDVTLARNGHVYEAKGLVPEEKQNAFLGFGYNGARERQGFFGWLKYSFAEVRFWIHVVFQSIRSLLNGSFSIGDMSGPVGIVTTIGDTYEAARPEGIGTTILTLINILIMLSANLGVMNLLPFPALDGGRLLLMLIEAIRRKPLDPRLESRINYVGLAVLLVFMIYVSTHDVLKLF